MRRFFRSAAFPILIVIVLAFFAQRLISPSEQADTPTWNEFRSQVINTPEQIKEVTVEQKTETLKVVEADDSEYSIGYPNDSETSVINMLTTHKVDTNVEGIGGSS